MIICDCRRREARLIFALTIQSNFPLTIMRKYGEVEPNKEMKFASDLLEPYNRGTCLRQVDVSFQSLRIARLSGNLSCNALQ